jgi:hypothetical protein
MKIQASELEKNGYVLMDTLNHMEIVPFVQLYLKKRTLFTVLYYAFNIIALALIGLFFGFMAGRNSIGLGDAFGYFSYGILFAFLLIPIHEYIHVLAYRSQGAVRTSYDVNWKKFYFMAVADQFVADRREFQIVALAPFAVISTALFLLFFLVNPLWQFTIIGVFFTHTACCSGDFGLLSYFSFHKKEGVVTYDNAAEKRTYFYIKN